MKTLLSIVLSALLVALASTAAYAEDAKFDDKGITFTYPKEWKAKTASKTKALTSVTVDNSKGSYVTIGINDPSVDPKTLSSELDATFKKIFEGKVVKDSDKPVKRKLLGAERDGQTLEVEIVKGVTSKLEYYAFKGSKNTISVLVQTTSIDPDGKKSMDSLLESLAEKK